MEIKQIIQQKKQTKSSAEDNQQGGNLEPIPVVNDNPLTGNDQPIFNQTTQEFDSEPDMYDTTLLKQPYTDQSTNKDDDQTVTASNLSGKAIQQWEHPRRVISVTDCMPNRSSIQHDDITSRTINPDVGSQNPVPAEKLQKRSKKTKLENAEDKAYILKLENEINLLKSTVELQNRQSRLTEHIENNRTHTNQTVNQPSHTDINNIQMNMDKQLTEQRLRMIECQLMQNMTMDTMISNQQTQIIMHQQQLIQASMHTPYNQYPACPPPAHYRFMPPPPGYTYHHNSWNAQQNRILPQNHYTKYHLQHPEVPLRQLEHITNNRKYKIQEGFPMLTKHSDKWST